MHVAAAVISRNGEMKTRDTYKQISNEYQKMVSFVRSRLRDSAERDAEDVVQDVLTSVIDKLNVDTHPIFSDHRPLFFTLKNEDVDLTSVWMMIW